MAYRSVIDGIELNGIELFIYSKRFKAHLFECNPKKLQATATTTSTIKKEFVF